MIKYLCK